jgi:hypothetical protein
MFRRTADPMASVWPTQAFSAKPFSPERSCTTMFGRNRRTSKRPCGIELAQAIERGRGQEMDHANVEERCFR